MEENVKEFLIQKEDEKKRLDVFLSGVLDLTRSYVKILIENGNVFVNKIKIVKSGCLLKHKDLVLIHIPKTQNSEILAEDIKLNIVYEDEYLAVIDKPQDMIVHPAGKICSGTLVNALMYHFKNLSSINGEFRPGIVHRLDKDTSGLIVVAKDDKTHLALQKQIQTKVCHRIYNAVVYGKFSLEEGKIENCLCRGKREHEKIFVVPNGQGRIAVTNYKVLQYSNGFSFMEYELKTGRTHQIRVHSAFLNHPIVGDKLYGRKEEKFCLKGQLLHASKLIFIHPTLNKKMEFVSPLPDYFQSFLIEHGFIIK